MKPTIAVTGGDSFLGAQVLRQLQNAALPLVAARRREGPRWHLKGLTCKWRPPPVDDVTAKGFLRDTQGLIHLAYDGEPHVAASRGKIAREVRRWRQLLNISKESGVLRVVLVVGPSALLSGRVGPRDEHHLALPGVRGRRWNLMAALEAETYRYLAAGMEVVIAIPTLLIGPGAPRGGLEVGVINADPDELPVGSFNLVDVRDAAASVTAAIRHGRAGRRFVIGGTNTTLVELRKRFFDLVEGTSGRTVKAPYARGGRRPRCSINESANWCDYLTTLQEVGAVESDRTRGELGVSPRSLERSHRDQLRWMERVGQILWAPV